MYSAAAVAGWSLGVWFAHRDRSARTHPRDHCVRLILAAIDNASAVAQTADHQPTVGRSGDVARRLLSLEDLEAILYRERSERERAMDEYSRVGRPEEVAKLQQEVRIITRYLALSD